MHLSPLATSCDGSCEVLSIEEDSLETQCPKFLLPAAQVGTLCLAVKILDSQRESRAQHKPLGSNMWSQFCELGRDGHTPEVQGSSKGKSDSWWRLVPCEAEGGFGHQKPREHRGKRSLPLMAEVFSVKKKRTLPGKERDMEARGDWEKASKAQRKVA